MHKAAAGELQVPFVPRELQLMWLSLMEKDWSSLAIVPAEPRLSPLRVASALEEVVEFFPVGPCRILDATGRPVEDGAQLAEEVQGASRPGGIRTVVAVDPLLQALGGFRAVQAAQAALLVLRLGTDFVSAERTIGLVGREKILGCVVVPS